MPWGPYLDDAVEPRDGVDLGSLGDQLALDLVAHRLDGVRVRPDEGHALRCLATETSRCQSNPPFIFITFFKESL